MDADHKFDLPTPSTNPKDRSNPYASLIGSLMYIAVATWPDIAYAIYCLASYSAKPDMEHWSAAKKILHYLSRTRYEGITYKSPEKDDNPFIGYSDASYASKDDTISISGYTFIAAGGAITWASKKQMSTTLSSTEAEYVCMSDAACEAVWLRNLHSELGSKIMEPTLIYRDNMPMLAIAQNEAYHKWTKHFEIKNHYIRE